MVIAETPAILEGGCSCAPIGAHRPPLRNIPPINTVNSAASQQMVPLQPTHRVRTQNIDFMGFTGSQVRMIVFNSISTVCIWES